MAITIDSNVGLWIDNYQGGSPRTFAYTVTNGVTYLTLGLSTVYTETNPPSALTYNGVSMTKLVELNHGTETDQYTQVWGLANPDTGSSHNFSLTIGGAGIIMAATIRGLTGTTTKRTEATATGTWFVATDLDEPTVTSSNTVNGDMVLDWLTISNRNGATGLVNAVATVGAGQTQDSGDTNKTNYTPNHNLDSADISSHEAATGSSVVMSWGLANDAGANLYWGIVAIPFIPTAAGGGPQPQRLVGGNVLTDGLAA